MLRYPMQDSIYSLESELSSIELPKTHNFSFPFGHLTNLECMEGIFQAASLVPSHCPNFGKEILYFYYSNLSYTKKGAVNEPLHAPVGILLKSSVSSLIDSYYPFDTGAFFNPKTSSEYTTLLGDPNMYKVPATSDHTVPCKLIFSLWGSHRNYSRGSVGKQDDLPSAQLIKNLKDFLAKAVNSPNLDHRARTIECHTYHPVSLIEYLELIIMPDESEKRLCEFIDACGFDMLPNIETYPYQELFDPKEACAVVRNIGATYIKERYIAKRQKFLGLI
jgi:hypothetical protein